jgi:hypothetical protein
MEKPLKQLFTSRETSKYENVYRLGTLNCGEWYYIISKLLPTIIIGIEQPYIAVRKLTL